MPKHGIAIRGPYACTPKLDNADVRKNAEVVKRRNRTKVDAYLLQRALLKPLYLMHKARFEFQFLERKSVENRQVKRTKLAKGDLKVFKRPALAERSKIAQFVPAIKDKAFQLLHGANVTLVDILTPSKYGVHLQLFEID